MRRASLVIAVFVMGLALAFSAQATPQSKISVPRLHINSLVGWTANEHYLASGPAWWGKSARPGEGRTVAIAGHDVTPVPGFNGHGPFHDLNALNRGDKIYIEWRGKTFAYIVTGRRLIPSTDLHIADDVGHERLILTTCWPRYSSAYRMVVYALPA